MTGRIQAHGRIVLPEQPGPRSPAARDEERCQSVMVLEPDSARTHNKPRTTQAGPGPARLSLARLCDAHATRDERAEGSLARWEQQLAEARDGVAADGRRLGRGKDQPARAEIAGVVAESVADDA